MPPARPIPSATILMVRDSPNLQVFMAVRHRQIDFASGALVFPGGKVNRDDQRPDWVDHLDGDLGPLTVAGIAAVRETFEESGLLLCRPAASRNLGGRLAGPDVAQALAAYRGAVDRGETSFLELIANAGLVLALDLLVHFAHWITPEFMPKRFDTHFFLTRAPEGQIAAHDGRETTDSAWLEPSDALARATDGRSTILFPTRLNLEVLAEASNADEAVTAARARPVVPVMPAIDMRGGSEWLTIPENAGYRTCAVPLAAERGQRA